MAHGLLQMCLRPPSVTSAALTIVNNNCRTGRLLMVNATASQFAYAGLRKCDCTAAAAA